MEETLFKELKKARIVLKALDDIHTVTTLYDALDYIRIHSGYSIPTSLKNTIEGIDLLRKSELLKGTQSSVLDNYITQLRLAIADSNSLYQMVKSYINYMTHLDEKPDFTVDDIVAKFNQLDESIIKLFGDYNK